MRSVASSFHVSVSLWISAAAAAIIVVMSGSSGPVSGQEKLNVPRVDHYVTMETTKGPIVIRVYFSVVPYTASNFLNLVGQHFYNGLSFHRVEDWVVQGGDPKGNGTGDFVDPATGQPRLLKLEINPRLTHDHVGMVAMARGSDPNSASCQFYILKRPMSQLNGQYAVFGRVIRGMDTVNKLMIGDRIVQADITDPKPAPSADAAGTPATGTSAAAGTEPVQTHPENGSGSASKRSPSDSGF